MELWYTEKHTPNAQFSIKINRQLYSAQSPFQRIEILESQEFGKILVLDGFLMITEKDEFIYHEMITHVPMAVNLCIENILVIGAGDGGVLSQLTKYPSIKRIDLVEIDAQVVEVCKKYFPNIAAGFSDNRVNTHFEDGLKFVRAKQNDYDLIIVDSTDPFGPGENLFTKEFYGSCFNALTKEGILVNQHESVYYHSEIDQIKKFNKKLKETFPICKVYQAHIPTYPSGHWLFGFASKVHDPTQNLNADKWNALNIKTLYYNTNLHKGCFALPNYVNEALIHTP